MLRQTPMKQTENKATAAVAIQYSGEPAGNRDASGDYRRVVALSTLVALILAFAFGADRAEAAPPGVLIINQAAISFNNSAGRPVVAKSNTVKVFTTDVRGEKLDAPVIKPLEISQSSPDSGDQEAAYSDEAEAPAASTAFAEDSTSPFPAVLVTAQSVADASE